MENLILILVAVFMQTLTIGQAQWSRYPQYPQYSQQPQYYFTQPMHQQHQQQQPAFYQQPQAQQQQQHRQPSFQARQAPEPIIAVALMQGQNVSGIIHFVQMPGTVNCQVTGRLTGLEPGDHGFHIHQYGDMRDGCKSMGGHFNPDGNQHGAPMDNFRHAGDLGNIEADQNGVAELNFIDPRISLQSGPYTILGRGVVVHAKQDDLGRGNTEDSKKTGNAGGRVACGIVALAAVIDDSAK